MTSELQMLVQRYPLTRHGASDRASQPEGHTPVNAQVDAHAVASPCTPHLRLHVSASPSSLETVRQVLYDLALDALDWFVDDETRLVLNFSAAGADPGQLWAALHAHLGTVSAQDPEPVSALLEQVHAHESAIVLGRFASRPTRDGLPCRASPEAADKDLSAEDVTDGLAPGMAILQASRNRAKAWAEQQRRQAHARIEAAFSLAMPKPDLTQPLQRHPLLPAQALYVSRLDLREPFSLSSPSGCEQFVLVDTEAGHFLSLEQPLDALESLRTHFGMTAEQLRQVQALLVGHLVAQFGYNFRVERAYPKRLRALAENLPKLVRLSQKLQTAVDPTTGELIFEGRRFADVAAVARHHAVEPSQLNRRIRQGCTLAQAVQKLHTEGPGHSRQPRSVLINGQRHRSLRAAATALGLNNPSSLQSRANAGKLEFEDGRGWGASPCAPGALSQGVPPSARHSHAAEVA